MKEEEFVPNIAENNMEELFLDEEQFKQPTEDVFGSNGNPFLHSTNEATANLVDTTSFEESISNSISNTTIQEDAITNDFSISNLSVSGEASIPVNSFTEMKVEPTVVMEKVETPLNANMIEKKIESNKESEKETKSNLTFILVFGILLFAITFLLPYISGYK